MLRFVGQTRASNTMSKSLLTGISRVVIALVSAVLFAAGVSAQVGANQDPMLDPAIKYTIVGTVEFAPTNMELRGIKVELFAPSGEPLNSVFTDSRGYFEFGNLPLGYYTVTINEEGFEPYKEMVGIVGRPGARVYVRLRPAAKDGKPAAPGNAVSARELALPQKTQDTLHKGLDALFENRDAAKSVTFFEQVIQLSPDYYEAYYDEGVAYLRLKKMDEAETAFHKAVDLSKGHFAEPYIELASIYADKEKFPDAETMARKGMGIQPDSWRAHYELARILYGEGLPVDAEQSALEAKRLEPKFPKLYIVLANIQLRLGKNQAVVEDLDTYLKLAPDGAYTSQAKELKEKTEKLLGHPAPPAALLPLGGQKRFESSHLHPIIIKNIFCGDGNFYRGIYV